MPKARFYALDTTVEGSPCWKGTTAPPSTTFETHETGQWLVQKNLVTTTYEYTNGCLQLDTSGIPDDATITAATLWFRPAQKVDFDTTFNLTGEYYDFGGKPSTSADWVENVSSAIFTAVDLATITNAAWNSVALTDLSGINKSGITGIRLAMSSGTPTGQNLLGFNSYTQNAQSFFLEVTYTLSSTVFHVDVDAVTESVRTDTSDPYTFNHTPVGTPNGILVAISHPTDSTNYISGVTYGGVAMTSVTAASCTSAEPAYVNLYFLGSSIPTGTQTVSVDLTSGTTVDFEIVCISLISNDGENLEVLTQGAISNTATSTVGSQSLSYGGREGMAFGVHYWGGVTNQSLRVVAGNEKVFDEDWSASTSMVTRQSFPGTADFTAGVVATVDDMCAAFAVITRIHASKTGATTDTITYGPSVAGTLGRVGASTLPLIWGQTTTGVRIRLGASTFPLTWGGSADGFFPRGVLYPPDFSKFPKTPMRRTS